MSGGALRPTRRGLAVAAAVPVLAVLSWLFGQPELAVGAVAAAALLVVALVGTRWSAPRLQVHRAPRPARVPTGDACRVHLRVRNAGRRRTPVVTLRDDVGRFGRASLDLAPLPGGATRDAVYAFPTTVRGVHPVGPLELEVADPFALVRSRWSLPGRAAVVVLPRTYPLTALPPARGQEREVGVRATASGSTVDEELASLRPYEPGDDVRRIHWRSTARTGEPVVRQFEEPWQRRTTVLLDTRPSAHDEASFERAVSAAASVVAAAVGRGELVRLVTTAGRDTGFAPAAERADALLDELAAVSPDGRGSLTGALRLLGRTAAGGRLVTCAGTLGAEEARGLATATRVAGLHVLVLTRGRPERVAGGPMVVVWDGEVGRSDLSACWTTATLPAVAVTAGARP